MSGETEKFGKELSRVMSVEYIFDILCLQFGSWDQANASREGRKVIEHYLDTRMEWIKRRDEIIAQGPSAWARRPADEPESE